MSAASNPIDKIADDDLNAYPPGFTRVDFHCASCDRRGRYGWADWCWINTINALLSARICEYCRRRLSNVWLVDREWMCR